ncbi:MAG: hypothetical protein SPJ70_03540 [Candidatus Borkfalkiaceae bacterium]|nr:hypothetical protein [Christensenellaceae bacterium]
MDINYYKPCGTLNKKHLISLENYTEEEIYEILKRANDVAERLNAGEKQSSLKNKYVYLITKIGFSRSRIAFETAVTKLSGTFTVSSLPGDKIDSVLTDSLSMQAIEYYGVDAIVVRTDITADAETLEKHIDLPIINANPRSGPLEALSALSTVWEKKGRLSGLKIATIGNPSVFAENYLYAFVKCGADVTVICPKELYPDEKVRNYCAQYGDLSVTDDLTAGLKDADCVFVSDDESMKEYALTADVLSVAKPTALILHSLPISKENSLISDEVAASPNFVGLRLAENLQKIIMAVLDLLVAK